MLVDEVGTPDCSRFVGNDGVQYDKQVLRDWLTARWPDKSQPPPGLSDEIVLELSGIYRKVQAMIEGPSAA
jgi:phosphoribosylaminoimidazole-succinocarboxamide synthase